MKIYKIKRKLVLNKSWYLVYRKFLGFLWWHNFSDDIYRFKLDAIKHIEKDRTRTNTVIVYD